MREDGIRRWGTSVTYARRILAVVSGHARQGPIA